MLKDVLADLLEQRSALREALEFAAALEPRADYVDCWNLLDEIAEHDRRIAILRGIMKEELARRVTN